MTAGRGRPPRIPMMLLGVMLPEAERDEVASGIRVEYETRRMRDGRTSADAWVWRQGAGSVPSLLRRSWWRGWNGFESQGNQNRPGGPMLEQWIQDARFAMRRLRKRSRRSGKRSQP